MNLKSFHDVLNRPCGGGQFRVYLNNGEGERLVCVWCVCVMCVYIIICHMGGTTTDLNYIFNQDLIYVCFFNRNAIVSSYF